jgi:hypothetical protein
MPQIYGIVVTDILLIFNAYFLAHQASPGWLLTTCIHLQANSEEF